jgi:hypothetical protein
MELSIGALALAAMIAGAGCKKAGKASCASAVGNFIARVEAQIDREKTSDKERELVRTGLPGLREKLMTSCVELPWSQQALRCITDAKAAEDLEACDPFGGTAPPAP